MICLCNQQIWPYLQFTTDPWISVIFIFLYFGRNYINDQSTPIITAMVVHRLISSCGKLLVVDSRNSGIVTSSGTIHLAVLLLIMFLFKILI